ncbi:MAG: ABC transporter permease [Bacteroidota bacterium]
MLTNYLKVAFRNLFRNKIYSLINLFGLAIGVACCLLIFLYVQFEYSYDAYHPEADRIYQVYQIWDNEEQEGYMTTGMPMGANLVKDFPEIEAYTRIHQRGSLVKVDDQGTEKSFREDRIMYAEASFFDFFDFPLITAGKDSLLSQPNQVILSRSTALRFFGEVESALGKSITLTGGLELVVEAVMEDAPLNTDLQIDLLASFPTLQQLYRVPSFTSWWWPGCLTYVKAIPGADLTAISKERMLEFKDRYREESLELYGQFQAMDEIRLNGYGGGTAPYVRLFLGIACIVLLVACINYMNLSTARSSTRTVEVGVRKVVGAHRSRLIGQFLSEAFLMAFLSILLGLGLSELALPFFNEMAQVNLSFNLLDPRWWLGLLGLAGLLGLVAGIYPAIFMAQMPVLRILKGQKQGGGDRFNLRKVLVVGQFVVSICLIICTMVIGRQRSFLMEKSLGYEQEHLIYINIADRPLLMKMEVYRQALLNLPEVEAAAVSSWAPGDQYVMKYPTHVQDRTGKLQFVPDAHVLYVGEDFFKTMGMKTVDGRFLSAEMTTDKTESYMINEEMVRFFGEDSTFLNRTARVSYGENGQTIYEKRGNIVGVLKNFHTTDLHESLAPAVISFAGDRDLGFIQSMLVRLKPGEVPAQIEALKSTWESVFASHPFEMAFMEERLGRAYSRETQISRIFTAFAGLAILISCLGLLGLAAFTAQQRTKEIGVRKVLGASQSSILILLNRSFTRLVILALLIAVPLAYYVTQEWFLVDYPYQASFSIWPYLLSTILALSISWLTIGWHAWRAANLDPVKALRYE